MWRVLRKISLFVFTAALGLCAGMLLRFAFGRGLQWQAAAATDGSRGVPAGQSGIPRAQGGAVPAQNPGDCPAVVQLQAVAARDGAALERMVQDEWDAAFSIGELGTDWDRMFTQLIAVDPLRAMAWAQRNIPGGSQSLRRVFERWQKVDRAAAKTWAGVNAPELLKEAQRVQKLSDEELAQKLRDDPAGLEALFSSDSGLTARVAKLRAQQDPAAAFAWAQTLKSPMQRQSAWREAFAVWVQRDPAAAAEAWRTLPKGKAAGDALAGIVNAMPAEQALTWLRAQEQSLLVRQQLARRLPDGPEREALLAALPPGAGESISPGAKLFQAIRGGPSPQAFAALAVAARAGVAVDEGVAGTLYKSDPAGTLAALQALPDGKFKTDAAAQIGDWLAERPKSEAMARFAELPAGPFRDAAAEKLAQGLLKENPQTAMEFLRGQSAAARGRALPEVMAAWFSQNPAAAREEWDQLPAEDQRAAANELAESLAYAPTPEKMALLTTLPDVPSETYKQAAGEWVTRAPEQASAWVDALPEGAARDAAVGSMVTALTQRDWDPERAVVWAATIGDAAQRLRSLRTTLELWSLRDAAAAQAARQLLSHEDQQALTTP